MKWWKLVLSIAESIIKQRFFSKNICIAISSTGYKVPKPSGIESRSLDDCCDELRQKYPLLLAEFRLKTGNDMFITCSWRSVEKQAELYKIGRRGVPGEKIVTQKDGTTSKSRHNVYPSEAIDVCVNEVPFGSKRPVATWARPRYAPLDDLCDKYGVIWGGVWSIDDYPHIEVKAK